MRRGIVLGAFLALAGGLLMALYLPGSGAFAQSPEGVAGQVIAPLQKLGGSMTRHDNFGWSVARDGDYLVVGAPHFTTTEATNGSAFVFKRTGSGWTEVKELRADDGQLGDRFGYAVAISGDKIVVGAPYAGVGGWQEAGAAYVFRRDGDGAGNWRQVAKLTASDVFTNKDRLGTTVAIDGNTIVVGAAEKEVNNVRDAGAAYVFTASTPDSWAQTAVLTATTLITQDLFGRAVAVDGDTIVVGAPWANTGSAFDTGAAYVFYRSGSQWNQIKKILPSPSQAYDRFGMSLALDGDTLLVGAYQPGSPSGSVSPGNGAACVFGRNVGGADQWGQVARLTANDGAAGDHFGYAVGLDGNAAIVGANLAEVGGDIYRGAAYVFERDAGGADAWGQTAKLVASDGRAGDRFGFAVAARGDLLLVGAPYANRDSVVNTGAAYLFFRADYAVHLPVISR